MIDLTTDGPYRWHSNPDPRLQHSRDHIRGHQDRVAVLCADLSNWLGLEPSADLIFAANHHDESERIMGDWPGPLTDAYPWVAQVKARLDAEIRRDMGLEWRLSPLEGAILCLCDKLDAVQWAVPIQGWTDEWLGEQTILRTRAGRIGVMPWLEAKFDLIGECGGEK